MNQHNAYKALNQLFFKMTFFSLTYNLAFYSLKENVLLHYGKIKSKNCKWKNIQQAGMALFQEQGNSMCLDFKRYIPDVHIYHSHHKIPSHWCLHSQAEIIKIESLNVNLNIHCYSRSRTSITKPFQFSEIMQCVLW